MPRDSEFASTLANYVGQSSYAAGLDAVGLVPTAQLATGATTTAVFLRGDRTWASAGIAQVVVGASTTVVTGTTVLPYDNTPPQITEGDQYLAVSYASKAIGNTVVVEAEINGSRNAGIGVAALYDAASTSAVTATRADGNVAGGVSFLLRLMYNTVTATTATQTYVVRAGPSSAGTFTLNGEGGAGLFGNAVRSTIVLTEFA